MRKLILTALCGFCIITAASAQTPNPDAPPPTSQEDGPMKVLDAPPRKSQPQRPPSALDKLRLGGSIGPFSFGNFTSIGVSPVAGFQATERLSLGGGLSYQYSSFRDPFFPSAPRQRFSNYGGRVFGMFNVFQNINLNAEYESLNVPYNDYGASGIVRRKWLNSAMVGASYSTPTGGRFARAFNIMVLYNLSYSNLVNPSDPRINIYPTSSPLVIRAVLF
ncbi:MAG: hypothetical protein MUE30_04020 [Spirosomaceae bacterium]|jgi:hypothetical protein|nr:hypothetical protein [Spirosomataceae bacterium]